MTDIRTLKPAAHSKQPVSRLRNAATGLSPELQAPPGEHFRGYWPLSQSPWQYPPPDQSLSNSEFFLKQEAATPAVTLEIKPIQSGKGYL